MAVTNICSLGPKINNVIKGIKLREITVALVTETWGKYDCKKYCHKILTMLELDGLGSVSLNRKSRRGGGVTLIFDVTKITIQEIPVIVPCNLEVKWCIGRPKQGNIKIIIFGVFYYPPRSRRKGKMLDHLVSTIHDLLNRFNDAEIILGGDRNDLDLAPVYNSVPGLKQIQTEPTHKRKTIDIVGTTMWRQY